MWASAISFTSSCLQQALNWFHTLMSAAGVSDGAILGFFAVIGVSSLIIIPIRGRALASGSDVVSYRRDRQKESQFGYKWW